MVTNFIKRFDFMWAVPTIWFRFRLKSLLSKPRWRCFKSFFCSANQQRSRKPKIFWANKKYLFQFNSILFKSLFFFLLLRLLFFLFLLLLFFLLLRLLSFSFLFLYFIFSLYFFFPLYFTSSDSVKKVFEWNTKWTKVWNQKVFLIPTPDF